MASLMELLGFSKPAPVAYSRITRTPIYTSDMMREDQGGYYITPHPVSFKEKIFPTAASQYPQGSVVLRPEELQQAGNFVIPHESTHKIYGEANLKSVGAKLAGQVGQGPRNRVLASPLYRSMQGYGGSEMLSDEGLAYSVGDSDEQTYVQKAAQEIKDPKLRAQLVRLNQNALASRKVGGIGSLTK